MGSVHGAQRAVGEGAEVVEDVREAERQLLERGATKPGHQPGGQCGDRPRARP